MGNKAMRMARTAGAVLLLAAGVAARAGTPSWARKVTFATHLAKDRNYGDLAQLVIDSLLKDPDIKGGERANLHRAIGEYHMAVTESIRGKDALQRVTEHLAKARDEFEKYAGDAAVKGEARFEVRKRLAWLSVTLARVYGRMLEDPDVPKTEHAKLKAEAVSAYRAAIKDFQGLCAEKKTDEEKTKAGAPKAKEAREKWEERYNEVRNEHVGVRICLNDTRLELGKLLKATGSPPTEWRPLIEEAARDYKQMLYDFSGAAGLAQINVKYAEAIVELGPERDQEALDRLAEVWEGRQAFLNHKAVPCQAMHIKASILFRQKKHDEATDALDEMIKARTGGDSGGWNPAAMKLDLVGAKVTDILKNIDEGDNPLQYDSKALARSFLIEADAYAARGKAAEDAKKPGKDVERLYGMAYELGVGVWEAKMPMDSKYIRLIEAWRTKGKRPPSMAALNIQIMDAIQKADRLKDKDPEQSRAEYRRAARLYTEAVGRTKPEPDELRKIWENIGRCYYAGGDYYAACHVFTALSRWFPDPAPQARAFAQSALTAVKAEIEARTKAKAGKAELDFLTDVTRQAYLNYEFVSGDPGAATIARGKDLRKDKDWKGALAEFAKVRPESKSYPYALFELAVTCREWFLSLPKDDQKGVSGQRILKGCLDAFHACLTFAKKRLPELAKPEQADERKDLLAATATSLTIYCDTLLKDYVNQPAKVVELTTGLKEAYPGLDATPNYSFLVYNRMHAAFALATGQDVEQAAKALAVIDGTWKIIKGFADFKYLANACKMGAMAYNELAKRLEAQALRTAEAAAKADLEKRAADARSRGLEFYLELFEIAPYQTLNTYRYVLFQLDKRLHEPKSADYRKIVGIATKALTLFKPEDAAAGELTQVKILLATSHCRLDQWRDAIPVLEGVDAIYEGPYAVRMKEYQKRKALSEENPAKYPPPRLPGRDALQAQAREWLGRAYIETKATSKLKDAQRIFAEQANAYPNRQSPKYWEAMYFLCEATRVEGDYEGVANYLYRVSMTIDENPVKAGKGTRKDFIALAAKVRASVEALADAARKNALLPTIETIQKKLGP